jgi:hypothetical protein
MQGLKKKRKSGQGKKNKHGLFEKKILRVLNSTTAASTGSRLWRGQPFLDAVLSTLRCFFFSENPWLTGGAISSSRDR